MPFPCENFPHADLFGRHEADFELPGIHFLITSRPPVNRGDPRPESVFRQHVRIHRWRNKLLSRASRFAARLRFPEINRSRIVTQFWLRWHEGEAKSATIPPLRIARARLTVWHD